MAPSERKEPGLGAPKSGSGADDSDDDFLNLIPDRLTLRSAPEDRDAEPDPDPEPRFERQPAFHAEPALGDDDDDAFDPPPAAAAPRSRLGPAGAAADEDDDDDYEEPEERSGGSRGVMAAVVVGAVAAGIAGWYLFLRDEPVETAAQAPVIAADNQPYKVRPADPGGMQVPNTDKMVYDRLGQNTQQEGGVENLLAQPPAPSAPPPPSEPVAEPVPSPLAEQPQAVEPEPLPEQQVAATPAPQPVPAPAPQPPAVQPPAASPAPAPAPKPTQQPQVAAVPPAPAPAPAAPAPAGGGSQMVQLAALKDEASARTAWNQAVASNKDLLGNLTLDIQRADLGAKGVFYRVRAKGLRSAEEAKALCDKLAARKVSCLVVR